MRLLRRSRTSAASAWVQLEQRIRAAQLPRSAGSWRVAVMGPKGGSGKTPTAATLGLLLAELRGETAAVVDANTHLGTLRRRLVLADPNAEVPLSMLAMANVAVTGQLAPEWPVLASYCDLVGRLRVFTNTGVDPALVEAMTGAQYSEFVTLLSRAAQLLVSDLGTSTAGEVAVAALDAADQLVLCTELRRDALEMALEWLSALYGEPVSYRRDPEDYSSIADGRYAELASRAIVVVAPGGGDPAALAPLLDWFGQATGAGRDGGRLVVVPHDAHIARGEQILLDELQPATRAAYLQVAAHVVDNFVLGRLGIRRRPPAPAALPQLAVDPIDPQPVPADYAPVAGAPAWPPPVPAAKTRPGSAVPAEPGAGRAGEQRQVVALPPRASRTTGSAAQARLAPVGEPTPRLHLAPLDAGGRAERATATAGPVIPPAADAGTVPVGAVTGVGSAASLALGRDLAGVLGIAHTEGEVCTGCAVRGCGWPVPPGAGAGERA